MRQIFRTILAASAMLAIAAPAAAQKEAVAPAPETRLGEDGFESPPASLDRVDWLIGQWVGAGIGGAPAMESWLAPSGGVMVGTFVQETAGEDGSSAIMFTEHMYLMEEEGSLVLRLKHFNADLTGWEEKDDMLSFRLVAIEPCVAYFNALTLRCLDKDNPGSGIVAAVRMKSDKPEPQELVFRFNAADRRSGRSYDCDGTTYAINQCLAAVRDRAKVREAEYLEAALGGKGGLPAQVTERENMMRAAQVAAEEYREQECGAVYEQWKEGTIRNAMTLRCQIRLIDRRTHDLWLNWLTYQDSAAPILPEPGPTQ